MPYIEQSDLENYVTPEDLQQITDGDASMITAAVDDAIEHLSEKLRQRYDVVTEYNKTEANRHRTLLKHTIAVTLYFLCEKVAFDQLPENRVTSFKHANDWAKDCASGTIQPSLQQIDSPERGISIRYGKASKNNFY
jgi:phage gp36-like protein